MNKKHMFLILFLTSFCSCSYFSSTPESSTTESGISKEEQLLSSAMESFQNEVYSLAKKSFEQFKQDYPTSYHLPLVELKIADCHFFLEDFTEAGESYEAFVRTRPKHEASSYASYRAALSHLKRYRGSSKDQMPIKTAHEKFTLFIKQFPESEYIALAKKSIAECEEQLAEHELSVAEFYSRQSKKKAALSRLRNLFKNYPNSKAAQISPEALATIFSLNQSELKQLLPRNP